MHKRSQKKTFYKIIKARPSYKEASLLSLNALRFESDLCELNRW
jgi:hypothetical protein